MLKASLFNKGLPFRDRPSQSGLPCPPPPCVPGHVGRGGEVILYNATLPNFERVTKARGKMTDDVADAMSMFAGY